MGTLVKKLKTRLSEYLSGTVQPEEFHEWFAMTLATIHESNEAEAESLCHMVEWEFLDRERGVISSLTLRRNLEVLASVPPNETIFGKPMTVGPVCLDSGAGNQTSSPRLQAAAAAAVSWGQPQISHETVFA